MKSRAWKIFLIVVCASGLAIWGRNGHSTIGLVAEQHLSPEAKKGVKALLGDKGLADVETWTDDNIDRSTAPWHFINVPLGLSFDDFKERVAGKEGVYRSLQQQKALLKDGSASNEDRINALKYIVHFVGDIHQPMHVSRVEDKAGNTLRLQFEGYGMNLQSLWDTRLLEQEGLNSEQLAEKLDHPTETQLKRWQADPEIIWAWESYQISSQLYRELDQLKNRTLDNAYYQSHIGIVHQRIEQAGIRLAGLLNAIFSSTKVAVTAADTNDKS